LDKARPRLVRGGRLSPGLAAGLAGRLPLLEAIYHWNLRGATGAFAPVARRACLLLGFFGKGHCYLMRYFYGLSARSTVKGWNLVVRQAIGFDEICRGGSSRWCSAGPSGRTRQVHREERGCQLQDCTV
jgi:hypothetical protein